MARERGKGFWYIQEVWANAKEDPCTPGRELCLKRPSVMSRRESAVTNMPQRRTSKDQVEKASPTDLWLRFILGVNTGGYQENIFEEFQL